MRYQAVDAALGIAGIVAEALFLALLTRKRVYRLLPIFYCYLLWALLSDCGMILLHHRFPSHYLQIYIGEMSIDSAMQYLILVELLWSVLRPFRESLPRGTVVGISILIVALGAAAWPFSNVQAFAGYPAAWHVLSRLEQTISILRIVFFLALAGCSNFLQIGWRDRELQVATGLGFFSLISMSGSVLHAHQALDAHYHIVDQVVGASYLCSLVYWVIAFAHAEAPRREFTPQMRTFLTTIAKTASVQRAQIAEAAASQARGPIH